MATGERGIYTWNRLCRTRRHPEQCGSSRIGCSDSQMAELCGGWGTVVMRSRCRRIRREATFEQRYVEEVLRQGSVVQWWSCVVEPGRVNHLYSADTGAGETMLNLVGA